MRPLPFISVVVPTYNRLQLLQGLIVALDKQDYPGNLYEILIVDDGSSDGTISYLSSLPPNRIRAFAQKHGGASRARNLGAANARGEILAFTDDDCMPAPDWLSSIGSSHARYGSDVALLGHTWSEHPAGTFLHSVFKDSEPVVTCNFALPRHVFEEVGGFDPHFILYFEDEDLGLRVRKAGVPIIYDPSMRVLHPSKYQSFKGFLRLRSGFKYFCYMSQKHPDCDHWLRDRHVTQQIWKRSAIIGIPLVAGYVWSPGFLVLVCILLQYIVRDGLLARKYKSELATIGFRVRPVDMASFAFLNWAVPFLDGARIAKGYIQSYGEIGPWAPGVASKPSDALHVRWIRATRTLLSFLASYPGRVLHYMNRR